VRIFVDASLLIYLNVGSEEPVLDLWTVLIEEHSLYTDVLVLDEVIWVSRRKYRVSYEDTIGFLEELALPYMTVLPLTLREYTLAARYMAGLGLKPSDALHLAAMELNGIHAVATEDRDFDRVEWVKRIWVNEPGDGAAETVEG